MYNQGRRADAARLRYPRKHPPFVALYPQARRPNPCPHSTHKISARSDTGSFRRPAAREDDSRAVVDHIVESNLFGHPSHGVMRYAEYLRALRDGRFKPRATPRIVSDHPCTAVVDANGALGQIGANFATRLAIEKARTQGMAAVGLRNTSHIGRVGRLSPGDRQRGPDRIHFRQRGSAGLSDRPLRRNRRAP